jgi:hypothetical protein
MKRKTPCAAGNAEANHDFGKGGFPQFFIRQEDAVELEVVGFFSFK